MNTDSIPLGWELRNLGGVDGLKPAAQFLDNLRVPVNEKERAERPGPYPYFGANGQQGWIDDFLFDEELVLLDSHLNLQNVERKIKRVIQKN